MQPAEKVAQQSFPLSALFLLLAACGVVCALLTPAVRAVMEGRVGGEDTAMASFGGSLLAMCGGAIIGLYHYRQFRGLGWGILTGGVLGMIVGPIILTPPRSLGSLIAMSLGGSVVLLITGVIFGTVLRDPENDAVDRPSAD